MDIFFTILILILVVALSGVVTRIIPFQVPLPLIQILLGALITLPDMGLHVHFDPKLFLVLFIPPLLFADGRRTSVREFLQNWREILGLAMFLVFLTVIGLGYLIHLMMPEIPLVVAFALAAVLSPTDAVALSAIVGKGRIPKSIMNILEGEALTNDASGLVSLNFAILVAVGAMTFNTTSDYAHAGLMFLYISLGGALVGVTIIWLYTNALRLIERWSGDDAAIQIMLLLLLPFAAYIAAEYIGVSGILAAVTAGLTMGHFGIANRAPLMMRLRANSVWSMLEFILNGTVFLMLGLQIPGIIKNSMLQLSIDQTTSTLQLILGIVWIYIALMIVRFLWLSGLKIISHLFLRNHPLKFGSYTLRELLVATFAGVRGTITLAGALSIPLLISTNPDTPFPERYQVIFLSAGVILFSLICGVLILPLLLRGLLSTDRDVMLAEEKQAKQAMLDAAIASVLSLQQQLTNDVNEKIDPQLLSEVSTQVITVLREKGDVPEKKEEVEIAEKLERRFHLNALRAERAELYRLNFINKISNDTLNELLYELDLMETVLIGHDATS